MRRYASTMYSSSMIVPGSASDGSGVAGEVLWDESRRLVGNSLAPTSRPQTTITLLEARVPSLRISSSGPLPSERAWLFSKPDSPGALEFVRSVLPSAKHNGHGAVTDDAHMHQAASVLVRLEAWRKSLIEREEDNS